MQGFFCGAYKAAVLLQRYRGDEAGLPHAHSYNNFAPTCAQDKKKPHSVTTMGLMKSGA
jgi:hypothetical protein